ncbi:MAG: hypothetical protein KC425_19190, partial [Anaerolineales bacterium]|nr:hypothetical protein [Anaerolineales bacterium]
PTPASGDPFSTFAGVNVFQPDPANPALWVAHTTGSRAYDPLLPHFIEIYAYEQGDWQLRGHLDLELADFLYAESMRRVSMPDGQLWLEFNSGIGAHGGCYDLLRFDGAALTPVVNHCHSSPLASGGVHDANQDGAPDLILNQTIDYVFCYACGVRIPMFRVLTFAEGSWQEVPLRLAGADVPEAVRQANDTAVSHAQAGLWQSASALIAPLETADPVVRWNQVLIALHVYDLQAMVAAGAYPLLNQLFYGDYAAALDVLRPFAPAQLFSPPAQNPLIAETVAQGWETDLATYVQTYADLALGVHPDLAAAYFLRGWAAYLLAPGDAAAVADIQQAAALAPDDPLLTAAAAFVTP